MSGGPAIEIIYDIPRMEEKLLVKAARMASASVILTNIRQQPLRFEVSDIDVSLVRCVSMYGAMHAAAIREGAGIRTVNRSSAIMTSGDKVLTLSRLKSSGLPVPRSAVGLDHIAAYKALEYVGLPAVDKPPVGSWGRLIALIRDNETFKTILEHRDMIANRLMRTHIIQEYVDIPNRDIRTLVVGDEVLAAMFRYRSDGDWRTNVAQGAVPIMAYLNDELREISLKAAQAVGGEIVSIDVFEMRDGGYLVNEVNGVPEFKGFIRATGIDVPAKIIDYLVKLVRC
ncbi:MAG: lysine biosynthesis protein LysX [Aigarchaeota archaeon]|nr:lysine biosynthesis protein LysX [Candidatus Pelearchaeum maunauluense]